jgi:Fur family transcriptional regulator, ferric uptake regulator
MATLKGATTALSAGSLHKLIPEVDKATIYRNLDQFVAEGIVKKLTFGGAETLYEYQRHPHHHAVCIDCDRIIHFTAQDEKIKHLLELTDFQVTELELTVKGVCNHSK